MLWKKTSQSQTLGVSGTTSLRACASAAPPRGQDTARVQREHNLAQASQSLQENKQPPLACAKRRLGSRGPVTPETSEISEPRETTMGLESYDETDRVVLSTITVRACLIYLLDAFWVLADSLQVCGRRE